MAINNTGAMFKSFEFDGTDSRDFGVYITGAAVYDAPEREVEMISIPNRNGAFALDKGRFENIEITYPAGIYADTEADFAEAISDLRNFLCSKRGYCRLTDEYNPNEYRMAIYKSGLEVEPALLKAGEFEITFECMPQRFLTSGETEQAITSGGTITNPTLFDSKPQLQIWGYGDIIFGGDTITINNLPIGDIIVLNSGAAPRPTHIYINDEYANAGDNITLSLSIERKIRPYVGTYTSVAVDSVDTDVTASITRVDTTSATATMSFSNQSFNYGTAATKSASATFTLVTSDYGTVTYTLTLTIAYDGATDFRFGINSTATVDVAAVESWQSLKWSDVILNSSKLAYGAPLYIDLDIGEAYKIENDVIVSVNNAVILPAELPILPPGNTTITYDDTITQFKVIPRWWKI